MMIFFALLIALVMMLGVLALPYSMALALGSIGLGVVLLGVMVWRGGERRNTAIIGVIVFCLLLFLGWNFALMPFVNQPVVRELETLNPDGAEGAALIVYHPGRSDLQERATSGFADGLVEAGWRVDITTPSAETISDLTEYDLLIFGAQSYTWTPALPLKDYLQRVGDLEGKPVIAIISGLGETTPANSDMRSLLEEVNGSLIELYNVWQVRPIDDLYGVDDPYEAMRGVAAEWTLAAVQGS